MAIPRSRMLQLIAAFFMVCVRTTCGQDDVWSGFVNTVGSTLDYICPNNTVITGVASEFR